MAVRLALVPSPDQRDILPEHQGHLTGQARERRVTAPYRERQPHARHRSGHRLLGAREVGMRVDVHQSDLARAGGRSARVAGAEQAAEHDAAVATENNNELIVFEPLCDSFAERSAIRVHSGLVPGLAGRPREVLVARRQHLAEVGGVQPLDHAEPPGGHRARDSPPEAHRSRDGGEDRCWRVRPVPRRLCASRPP